jgi:hypothetical protein
MKLPNVLILMVSLPASIQAQKAAPKETIAEIVRQLGYHDDDIDRIFQLRQNPARAAGLLISELHPVKTRHIKGYEAGKEKYKPTLHVIMCICALRYLTGGLDFRAESSYRFGNSEEDRNRKYFLNQESDAENPPSPDAQLKFFGVWMSRGSYFIAPIDAQQKIIAKWRNWYQSQGKSFKYKPLEDTAPENWLF